MSAAAPAPAAPFDLKSAAWTLTVLRLQSADVAVLAAALDARFADSPGLFDGEGVAIDLAALREADAAVDFPALLPHSAPPRHAAGGRHGRQRRADGRRPAPPAWPKRRTFPPPPVPSRRARCRSRWCAPRRWKWCARSK